MVPLEASRKHYEQACAELIKAQVCSSSRVLCAAYPSDNQC